MQPEKQESTLLYEALAWFELNRTRVIAAVVVGLALVVAGYIYFWQRGQAELEANRALLALRVQAGPNESAASAADFLKVAETHASSRAADRALLLAAGQLFRDGRYAEAQPQFEKVAASDRRGLLGPLAALGVAACLDAQDRVDAALAKYQAVASEYPNHPVAARAKFAMALLQEARGEPAQALRLYDELIASPNAGRAAMEASVKREALLKQHPELAVAAPTVPVVPTAPPGAGTGVGVDTNKLAGQP
ncbi:MAG: tetratricopeptide repeat protein [Verrucomicrobia bacterium]|nr:tetratricopeptide repeat protein [Verrucomicrobiota bacterium]